MRLLHATDDPVLALGFSPDSRVLVIGQQLRDVLAWRLDGDRVPLRLSPGSPSFCRDVFFSPDGGTAYWLTPTGRIGADLATGRSLAVEPRRLSHHSLDWFAQTPDGRLAFAAHRPTPELSAWRSDGAAWTRIWCEHIPDAFPGTLALDPNGERLAYLSEKPGPRWWPEYLRLEVRDAASGAELAYGSYRYSQPECRLLFRPDGRQLIGLHAMTLLVWSSPKWGAPREVRGDTRKHFTAAAYDPSGRFVYTASNDATVTLWDAESWQRLRRYTWEIGPLKSIAVSPDGTLAAAGAEDGTVIVWDLE